MKVYVTIGTSEYCILIADQDEDGMKAVPSIKEAVSIFESILEGQEA